MKPAGANTVTKKQLDVYIQEAFYRGWAFGFSAGSSGSCEHYKTKATTAMINTYNEHRKSMKAAAREMLKRCGK